MKPKSLSFLVALAYSTVASGQNAPLADADADLVLSKSIAVIEEQIAAFKNASNNLVTATKEYCTSGSSVELVRENIQASYQSWVAIEMYQFGPIEQLSATMPINFWPDKKGFVKEHISQFDALSEMEQRDPKSVRTLSAAAQGLPAALILLDTNKCPALEGVTANLALFAEEIETAWFEKGGWAETMFTAGPDNPVYFSKQEAINELFTASTYGLERAIMRLEQPFGTDEAAKPNRAEALPLPIATELAALQIDSVYLLVKTGFGDVIYPINLASELDSLWKAAELVRGIELPLHEAVNDEDGRDQITAALKRLNFALDNMPSDIGSELGVSTGFSPADGD